MTTDRHTLSTTCPCEPTTAVDGHRNADGTPPDFEAMVGDPIDADGYLIDEVLA
ncbi:MAG: hypothetical protein ACRDNK_11795 [Solirubrobacteraceae bacterium]